MKPKRICAEDERGATVIETSFSVFAFVVLIALGLDIVLFSARVLTVTYVTIEAARLASVEDPILNPDREVDVENATIDRAAQFGVALTPENFALCPGTGGLCTVDSGGTSTGPFSVRVTVPTRLIFGLIDYRVTAVAYGKNEPHGDN